MTIMEDRTMRRILVIAALLAGTAVHAQTYTDVWNDVRNRSDVEMDYAVQVDGSACDRQIGLQTGRPSAKYRNCMAAHGWSFGHLVRNRAAPSPSNSETAAEEQSRIMQQNADDISRRIDDDNRHNDETNAMINAANDASNAAAAALSSGN
jgi:hypothetical protein